VEKKQMGYAKVLKAGGSATKKQEKDFIDQTTAMNSFMPHFNQGPSVTGLLEDEDIVPKEGELLQENNSGHQLSISNISFNEPISPMNNSSE
jgi:hypothetical protein